MFHCVSLGNPNVPMRVLREISFTQEEAMAEQQNLARYDLVKGESGWELKSEGQVVGRFASKAKALGRGGPLARLLDKLSGGEGTVRIHTEIGGIEEERTYPRSRDPRKSRG
jgi:hypothetical protein